MFIRFEIVDNKTDLIDSNFIEHVKCFRFSDGFFYHNCLQAIIDIYSNKKMNIGINLLLYMKTIEKYCSIKEQISLLKTGTFPEYFNVLNYLSEIEKYLLLI